MDGVRVGYRHQLGEIRLGGKGECLGEKGPVLFPAHQHLPEGGDEAGIEGKPAARLPVGREIEQHLHGKLLPRLPAGERVGFTGHQEDEIVVAVGISQLYRCRESAQQGRHRFA